MPEESVISPFRAKDLPLPTDDIERGKANIDEFGVTIHKGFLTAEQAHALKARLDEQAALEREYGLATFSFDESGREITSDVLVQYIGKPTGFPSIQEITLLVNKGRVFIELAKHPTALSYAQHVLRGAAFNIGAQLGLIIRKGAPQQPIHVDQVVPFVTPMPLSLNVMVALGDYTEAMGATHLVPGSHTWPAPENVPHGGEIQTSVATLELGDALLWESRTWHRQGRSVSDNPRYSVLTAYAVHFIKTGFNLPASIHDNVYESMSEEERGLFDFSFNGVGRISPRSLSDTRDNVGYKSPFVPELHR